jgi:hypothetical protein
VAKGRGTHSMLSEVRVLTKGVGGVGEALPVESQEQGREVETPGQEQSWLVLGRPFHLGWSNLYRAFPGAANPAPALSMRPGAPTEHSSSSPSLPLQPTRAECLAPGVPSQAWPFPEPSTSCTTYVLGNLPLLPLPLPAAGRPGSPGSSTQAPVLPATLVGLDSSQPGCQPRLGRPPQCCRGGSMLLNCPLIACCWKGTRLAYK